MRSWSPLEPSRRSLDLRPVSDRMDRRRFLLTSLAGARIALL
jgi:hypothetical protein